LWDNRQPKAGVLTKEALLVDSRENSGGAQRGIPSITRRTDKGLPKYLDAEESDIFIVSGAEDLVPGATQELDIQTRMLDVKTQHRCRWWAGTGICQLNGP
jgi:hypothetical protein